MAGRPAQPRVRACVPSCANVLVAWAWSVLNTPDIDAAPHTRLSRAVRQVVCRSHRCRWHWGGCQGALPTVAVVLVFRGSDTDGCAFLFFNGGHRCAQLVRVNVFPHAVLLVGLVGFMVVWKLFGPYLEAFWRKMIRGKWGSNKLQRKVISPYTAQFAKLIKDRKVYQKADKLQTRAPPPPPTNSKLQIAPGSGNGADGATVATAAGAAAEGAVARNKRDEVSAQVLSKFELAQGVFMLRSGRFGRI